MEQGWAEEDRGTRGAAANPALLEGRCRRAYFRVSGLLPIRITPIGSEEVEAAIFDLSMPDPLLQPLAELDEDAPLMARLQRIEEKLDLLLGASRVEIPRQLCGRDRQPLVFSGSGLALDVTWAFRKGDVYKVEILLPPPYSRLVRAVAEAVQDSPLEIEGDAQRSLPLSLRHMEIEERDALVAYSYDLQRFALRIRNTNVGGAKS